MVGTVSHVSELRQPDPGPGHVRKGTRHHVTSPRLRVRGLVRAAGKYRGSPEAAGMWLWPHLVDGSHGVRAGLLASPDPGGAAVTSVRQFRRLSCREGFLPAITRKRLHDSKTLRINRSFDAGDGRRDRLPALLHAIADRTWMSPREMA